MPLAPSWIDCGMAVSRKVKSSVNSGHGMYSTPDAAVNTSTSAATMAARRGDLLATRRHHSGVGAGEEPARRRVGWEVGLAVACGTHQRLGACSPLSQLSDSDLLMEVLKWVPIVVPDHCGTLKQAVDMALPGQQIFIRKGEHNVGEMPGQEAATASGRGVGHTVLDIHKSVHLVGERGTLLRGMLVLRESAGSASVRHMTVQDAGQCSLLCESGSWDVSDANIICGHACAVKAVGRAAVRLRRCRIGGEGEIGQAVALEYEVPRTWVDTAGSVREYACNTCRCKCMLAY